jgi:hypothetical protein
VNAVEAGRRWLLTIKHTTEYPGLLRVRTGVVFDVVRATPYDWARQALEELVRREAEGPVMLTAHWNGALEFLVPAGTAGVWDLMGTCCIGEGSTVLCPLPGMVRDSRMWLVPPDGSGCVTDPGVLRDVLVAFGR